MKIVTEITLFELKEMLPNFFGDMVKAVVDVERKLIAVDAQLHVDLEQLLLEDGSKQSDLWGINFYPDFFENEKFIEFDSMINVRPSHGNSSRDVENEETRKKIITITAGAIKK